ncbi:MAG: polysaccharide deacetylase family protein [Mogibacterium sp.]|nr:polysaccharide deacetylase family protein [Mogibacterium sp.]
MKRRFALAALIVFVFLILIALSLGAIWYITEPVITLRGEETIETSVKEGYHEPGYSAKFRFVDITDRVEVTADLDEKKPGEYSVDYSVCFLKKTANATRTVIVTDKEPPVITLNGGDTIKVLTNSSFEDPGYSAQDDSDGDVTASVETKGIVDTYDPGTYSISYRVSDSHGNEATKVRTVIVEGEPEVKPEKVIYLTFDDGPSEAVTPEILRILKEYDVPATFFIIGYYRSEENIDLLKEMLAQGHTIGIHGYSHEYGEIYESVPVFMDNIRSLEDNIRSDLNYEPFMIRFPGGSSNTVSKDICEGIMSKLVAEVQKEGYYYTDWNVDSGDASGNGISAEQIVSSVKRGCKKNRYNIVLMHDSGAKGTTAEALPQIIEWAKEEGYTFAAMEKGGPTVHQRVAN